MIDDTEAHVLVKGEWISVSRVEFEDISEDPQGYDIMTFTYEGETYRSRITQMPVETKEE